MKLSECKEFVVQKRAIQQTLEDRKGKLFNRTDILIIRSANLAEARELVSQVGIAAQGEINGVIEELVTQAVQAVFGMNYSFEMVDQIQRNKPETNFFIIENGRRRDLREDLGGGIIDLVALCLRVVIWAIKSPRSAPVIILDEPLKFLDCERLDTAGAMINKLSDMLGIQFIIVTHEENLFDCANFHYRVTKVEDVSDIVCLQEGEVNG